MKTGKKGSLIAIAILLVITVIVNVACVALSSMITAWMGANFNPLITGKKASASAEILSVSDATAQSLRIAEELENEGIVLLRNEYGTLPLESGTKVNLFGYGSVDPIYGGTGSGSGDTSKNIDVVKGLENAGLTVNTALVDFYKSSGVKRPSQNGYSGSNFTPAEVPVSAYTDTLLADAKSFSDTAIVVISRIGGEGGDLPMDMYAAGYSSTDDGRHYLELTADEEALLELVKSQGFNKTIVLINSSNAMELGFVEGVDAALWIGSPGAVGFNSVGNVLTGKVNPSGRLTDTYAYDLTSSPAYRNAGDFTYSNLNRNYVEYAEGIYVGYRYYETAAFDGFIDYDATVQYPFGYGLSYTSFDQSIEGFSTGNGIINMLVKVTNTGTVAGKDVAQVYYTAPYTKGGIEKAHVVLAGFGKTKLLQPGESETLTISFKAEDMASFDSKNAGAYVLEAGTYQIKLMKNSHEVIDAREYTVDSTIIYGDGNARSTDKTAAKPLFADVEDGQITTYLSRADWAGTFPKERMDGKEASAAVADAFTNKTPYAVNASDADIVYADNGLTLEDMAGLSYGDPKWELLLQQLSDEDMTNMILNGGWSTPAVESVGKPATSDLDGPAGINSLVSSLRGVSFPSEAVIGATWNVELVREFGEAFGAEAIANGVVGLYAPGMNIHRTPFSGRNFEYYSEDGLLSGKLGASQVAGAKTQGVYCYAKHFALNDQESNRLSISVWANEQSMRELYLKPFELTVKEGGTTAIMSSYSHLGTTWAGASKALITDVLRGEWGFEGMVVTDSAMGNTSWMDPNLAIRAGNDMMLCLMGASLDSSNNTARQAMREASHNILYTQANSRAVSVEADNTPYWYMLVALLDGILIGAMIIILLKLTAFKDKKLGWLGVVIVIAAAAIALLLTWALFLRGASAKTSDGANAEAVEPSDNTESESTAPAVADEKSFDGMELYDLADFWLGCHVYINSDNTFSIAYDYTEDAQGIEASKGTWEQTSDTEIILHPESGDNISVTLADGVWSCEVTEPNTSTVCHPKYEVVTSVSTGEVTPESGMELYDLADFWLGCHVYINSDNTFSIAYDYTEDAQGIEADSGTWERVSDTELTLHSESGTDIPVSLENGVWTCEVTEPNTSTVCHPKSEAAAVVNAPAEEKTYMVVFTEPDGTYYNAVQTTDATVVPETYIPERDGYLFAGWQTRPNVTKADLILGVSPYEVPTGASSLYGGAGVDFTALESFSGDMLLLYPRWVEKTEIHNAAELKSMAEDLNGWYVLASDIDLNGEKWTPIGKYFSNYETVNAPYWTYAFHGTLDGAGHTISGLYIEGCAVDAAGYDASAAVWRDDGVSNGGEAALFGAIAKATVQNLTFEKPVIEVESDNDATPYVAVVAGFDLGSTIENITVNEPVITVSASDRNAVGRASAWAAVSGLIGGGWSDTIEDCSVLGGKITVNGEAVKSHGGEYYVGSMLGEGYAFMTGNIATAEIAVSVEDKSTALQDSELIVNVGGMGGTNTTQTGGDYDTKISVSVNKPVGASTVSIGGLTGSQRYQVAENNKIRAEITTDCTLDPEAGKLYVGKVIGSTNVPYCIVQMIFAAPGSVDYSGCRDNDATVTLNGEAVTAVKGETLPMEYIANGDVTANGVTYDSNIGEVIAEFGSAVPAAFLQNCAIVLVTE